MPSCEYCCYMCVGDANYCEIKKKCLSDNTIKTYKCKNFAFNEISAITGNIYTPHKKKESIEEIRTIFDEVNENDNNTN